MLPHNYEYLSDEDDHWQVCEVCYRENDSVAHTFVKKYDDTHYWQECSVCGYQKDKVLATVDATTFANALEFKDAEGNLYLNWQAELKDKNDNVLKIAKMTETAGYEYDTLYSTTNEFDALYKITANIDGKGRAYKKYSESSMWVKTAEYSSKYTNDILASVPKSTFNVMWPDLEECTFTYNKEDQMYHGTYENSLVQYYYDIKFENGKLVSCVYTVKNVNSGETMRTDTWTISYGNAEVDLPEDSEIATLITYNSTENSYKLESVSLKANEAKTYVINITSELLDTYKGEDGKCEILGEFTASDGATLTLTVENSSGTTIYNMSEDINEFHCEISTFGKYYIKVTASAACTGAWDIAFADSTPAPTPVAGSSKETAIEIGWSSSDEKFAISDIALSTTEKWFVLEITEALHSSYKRTSGKYKLDKTVTLSGGNDATVTVVAENESGTEVNLASLGAGKYYIKITADKDCTGALSFAFNDGKISM